MQTSRWLPRCRAVRTGCGCEWRRASCVRSRCIHPSRTPSTPSPCADVWTTIKYSAGIAVVGLVFYAGYTIVVTLLPGGSSANAIMRHAGDVLRADPEVRACVRVCVCVCVCVRV